jgi:ankyrin repeat protein
MPDGAVDTPLTAAIQSSNVDLVCLLLERGASPSGLTSQGVSPLMAAAPDGSEIIARMLLELGAISEGFCASDYGRYYGHSRVARLIDEWQNRKA